VGVALIGVAAFYFVKKAPKRTKEASVASIKIDLPAAQSSGQTGGQQSGPQAKPVDGTGTGQAASSHFIYMQPQGTIQQQLQMPSAPFRLAARQGAVNQSNQSNSFNPYANQYPPNQPIPAQQRSTLRIRPLVPLTHIVP
jgi:hypothetical protein